MGTPYADATSGDTARGEITRLLRRFGCEQIGFMDDYERHEIVLAFRHRGRDMHLRASAQGWAALFLKENAWNSRRKSSPEAWKQRALAQGQIAVNSILRDWVKGQVMAIECGVLSFEQVFSPYVLLNDGRTMAERLTQEGAFLESAR